MDASRSRVDRLAVGWQAPALTPYGFRTGAIALIQSDHGDESFVSFPAEPSGDGRATVQPLVKFAAIVVIIIASNAGAHAQTAAPATAIPAGTTQGPWTSVKPGNSGSYCSAGEYAVGIEVEVAPSGTGPCAECISRLRVICRRYGI
jgi:hypothetical protein